MDNYNQANYNQMRPDYIQTPGDYKTVCILAMIFGIMSIFLDPFYLPTLAGIILGIIGHVNSVNYKTWGMVGWICGVISIPVQATIDILTLGIGICF